MSDFKKRLESIYEQSAQAAAEQAQKEAAAQKERQEAKAAAESLFDERVMPLIPTLTEQALLHGLRVIVQRSEAIHSHGWLTVEVRSATTYKAAEWRLTGDETSGSLTTELKLINANSFNKSAIRFDEVTEEWVQERLARLYSDVLNSRR